MAVTFEHAIDTLRNMFPSMDVGVIEALLETNGGAMETTVEQLLTLEGGLSSACVFRRWGG